MMGILSAAAAAAAIATFMFWLSFTTQGDEVRARLMGQVRRLLRSGGQEPIHLFAHEAQAEDRSRFVRDATVADGSEVAVGEHFLKAWHIQNVGSVPWRDRYVARQGPSEGLGRLRSERRTPIPDTDPGGHCRVEVWLTAPEYPGSCVATWKMTDAGGHVLLPDQKPIFVSVDVVAGRRAPG
jgi:hypothetical protein